MRIDVEEYYKKYAPMVMRRCRFLLKNEERARDAMQDVFVRLLLYKGRLKGEYPSSLLYKMATNICLNIIRDMKKTPGTADEEILTAIADCINIENNAVVRDYLVGIFKREKESTYFIAVMHFIDKMTLEETAREAGMSVSGVRKRLKAIRERVKEQTGGCI
jgi:RNA polymerase sigma-70 factor, ECF subfamily